MHSTHTCTGVSDVEVGVGARRSTVRHLHMCTCTCTRTNADSCTYIICTYAHMHMHLAVRKLSPRNLSSHSRLQALVPLAFDIRLGLDAVHRACRLEPWALRTAACAMEPERAWRLTPCRKLDASATVRSIAGCHAASNRIHARSKGKAARIVGVKEAQERIVLSIFERPVPVGHFCKLKAARSSGGAKGDDDTEYHR